MRIIAKLVLGVFGVITVALGVLFVGIQLSLDGGAADSEQNVSTEDHTDPAVWPVFGNASGSVPAYAVYVVEDRRWVVDCYSIGSVFVTPDSTHRFRQSDGLFLSHKAFCDHYL